MKRVKTFETAIKVRDGERVKMFFGDVYYPSKYVIRLNGTSKVFESQWSLINYLKKIGIVEEIKTETDAKFSMFGKIDGVHVHIYEDRNEVVVETDVWGDEDVVEVQKRHREKVSRVVKELAKYNMLADDVRCKQTVVTECDI